MKISTKKLAITAMLAALTAAGSAFRITIPIEIGGTTSFHLGNVLCALSGILLGPGLGGLAAGLGSAIYDCFNPLYISECWITFIMKFCYGFAAGLVVGKKRDWGYPTAALAAVAGAVCYAVLYLAKSFFYSSLLVAGLEAGPALAVVVTKLPATIFNAAVAILIAPVLALTIRKALQKNQLNLD